MDPVEFTRMAVGKRLPALEFRAGGRSVSVRRSSQRRLATVLLLTHGIGGCGRCSNYVRRLAESVDWRNWDGRLLVLVPGTGAQGTHHVVVPVREAEGANHGVVPVREAEGTRLGVVPVREAEGAGHRATRAAASQERVFEGPIAAWGDHESEGGPDTAILLVADRYGQIYDAERIGMDHSFPTPAAIEEWLRFLATQCPECGVIDEPVI